MSKKLRHFIYSIFTILIVSLITNNTFAQNRFWVNGTGSWSDNSHWSETSGGNSGATIPTKHDNVIFDNNSFSDDNQYVEIQNAIECNDFKWEHDTYTAILKSKYFLFKSNTKAELQVYGSLIIENKLKNDFFGDILLKSNDKADIKINTGLNSNV